jgi:hypothetical protein
LRNNASHHHHHHHHHHHKHPGLGHLARSVSRVKVAVSIVSLVSQLFSFLVGCKGMILKGYNASHWLLLHEFYLQSEIGIKI